MKSRERVVRAIAHDYPDRPPISHAILPSAILKHGQALQDILKDVHEDFGWDLLPDVNPENYPPYHAYPVSSQLKVLPLAISGDSLNCIAQRRSSALL